MSKRKTDPRAGRALRDRAMSRPELRLASVPRESPAGATSYAIKKPDPEVERLVAEFKAKRS